MSIISYNKRVIFGRGRDTKGRFGHRRTGRAAAGINRVPERGRRGQSHQLFQLGLGDCRWRFRRRPFFDTPTRWLPARLRRSVHLNGREGLNLCESRHGGWKLDLSRDQVGRAQRSGHHRSGRGGGKHHGVELADVGGETGHHVADLLHQRTLGTAAVLGLLRLERRGVIFRPAKRGSPVADCTDGRRGLGSVLSGVVLLCFGDVVKCFGTGIWKRGGRAAVAAAVCAFREWLDHGRLVGVLFFVDVDRKPLPQVGPPARGLLILGPRD